MMRISVGLMVLGLVAAPVASSAQEPGSEAAATALAEDPIFVSLYPPELIMQHRRAIGLNDEQRDAISRLIADLQGRVLAMQWELLDEIEDLAAITEGRRVDLDRAIDQMGDVLEKEKEIKQAHLEMLVRIKNLLTPEQQAMLDNLRGAASP
jgi:Spy/CpxP family protein refolding chaperone